MSWIRAFVFPENIAAWAVAERWETEQYESPFQGVLYGTPTISHQKLKKTTGWTPTHTYLALMGGFVETRDGEERVLSLDRIAELTPETRPELLAPISNLVS